MNSKPTVALIATGVWGAGFVLGLLMTAMSVMLFDAPGSENVVWTQLLFASVASAPVLCVLSVIGSWVAWLVTRNQEAGRGRVLRASIALLPLLSVVFVVIASVLLQVKCGGSFSCKN
ncbi:MAG: hypothetical protein QM817_19060 [Archangium sp.]